jgi:hypothetical protein
MESMKKRLMSDGQAQLGKEAVRVNKARFGSNEALLAEQETVDFVAIVAVLEGDERQTLQLQKHRGQNWTKKRSNRTLAKQQLWLLELIQVSGSGQVRPDADLRQHW